MTERKCIVMIHGKTNSSFTQYKIYPVYDDIVRNDDDVPNLNTLPSDSQVSGVNHMTLFVIPVFVNANGYFTNFKIYPTDEYGLVRSDREYTFSPLTINKPKFLILKPEDLIHD